jgi:hypothetical protein
MKKSIDMVTLLRHQARNSLFCIVTNGKSKLLDWYPSDHMFAASPNAMISREKHMTEVYTLCWRFSSVVWVWTDWVHCHLASDWLMNI